MKKTFQKLATVILIMAMVITSVSVDSLQVSAATKKPTKITLNAKSKTLTVGKSFQLKVKSVKPTKASKAVTYKSRNKSVATVSSKGKIVAKKAGKTTITVTSKTNKKVKASCKIIVYSKVKTVNISCTAKTLKKGKSFKLNTVVSPKTANQNVTYFTSNKKVATVSKNGKVIAKSPGKTTITVTSKGNKSKKAKCVVTVSNMSEATVTPSEDDIKLSGPRTDKKGNVTYDCIYFGSYPQSDATGKKKDKIKWRVLSVKDNDAFLVADQILDVMEYNKTRENVTWETCTMRSWLNGYGSSDNVCGIDYLNENFIDKAFSEKEQAAIYTTNVINDDNSKWGTEGGNPTRDKIFLLSADEVSNSAYGFLPYNTWDVARQRTNTHYVAAGGTAGGRNMNSAGITEWWRLRSPGGSKIEAAIVSDGGFVNMGGIMVDIGDIYAACPALHLNLSSSSVWSMADNVMVLR